MILKNIKIKKRWAVSAPRTGPRPADRVTGLRACPACSRNPIHLPEDKKTIELLVFEIRAKSIERMILEQLGSSAERMCASAVCMAGRWWVDVDSI